MMARIKAFLKRIWHENVVDDFEKHYPNDPWLF